MVSNIVTWNNLYNRKQSNPTFIDSNIKQKKYDFVQSMLFSDAKAFTISELDSCH